jgi:hypothetical protein
LVLQFQFVSLEADHGSLRPRLRLSVGAKSEYDKRLTLLNVVGACVLSSRSPMGEHKIGNFALEQLPVVLPVAKPQTQPAPLYLFLDLDHHLISRIEELRDGGDLSLTIVLYTSWLATDEATGKIEEPFFEAQPVVDRDRSQTIRIPQTDWLGILRGLRYGKFTVFEIETPDPPLSDSLAEAIDNLSQARKLFAEGNYEESMVRCRIAVESAVTKFEAKTGRQLKEALGSGSRAEFLRGLSSKMKEFMGSAAHATNEPAIPEPKNREDARLANVMAYAVVAYVASFLSKTSRQ